MVHVLASKSAKLPCLIGLEIALLEWLLRHKQVSFHNFDYFDRINRYEFVCEFMRALKLTGKDVANVLFRISAKDLEKWIKGATLGLVCREQYLLLMTHIQNKVDYSPEMKMRNTYCLKDKNV